MTENSPLPSMICDVIRRMNALSSTTRTRGFDDLEDTRAFPERADFDSAILEVQIHAASVIAAGILADDGNLRVGQHRANGRHVALADVDCATRHQVAEHARAAGDLRADASSRRAESPHLFENERYRAGRKLRRIRAVA